MTRTQYAMFCIALDGTKCEPTQKALQYCRCVQYLSKTVLVVEQPTGDDVFAICRWKVSMSSPRIAGTAQCSMNWRITHF